MRAAVAIPSHQAARGRDRIDRLHFLHRRHEFRARTQKRRAEIGVIEQLHFLRRVRLVGDSVVEGEFRLADRGGDFRTELQLRAEGLEVVHHAAEYQPSRLIAHTDMAGGDIVHMAVQGELLVAVLHGVSEGGEPPAHHQAAKTRHPAPAIIVVQADIGGMDDLLHRRVPAQPQVASASFPDFKAARGHDGEFHRAVVDVDDLHTFLPSAMQGAQFDAPGRTAFVAPVRRAHAPIGGGQVAGRIDQDLTVIGSPGRTAKGADDDRGSGKSFHGVFPEPACPRICVFPAFACQLCDLRPRVVWGRAMMRKSGTWMGAAFAVALAITVTVLALRGTDNKSIRLALELTARWSFLLFWLAYTGGALATLFGWGVLAGRGRGFGLAFAAAHLVHI